MSKAQTLNDTGDIPVSLDKTNSVCMISKHIELKLLDIIDYKPTDELKLSMGKILEFKTIDEWSVWMNVQDMGGDSVVNTEWISCRAWYIGYIERTSKKIPKNDTSKKSPNTSGHPF